MMYNNYNQFLNNQYNPYNNRQPSNNGITWVQGIEGAKAFQMAPNSNAILMDSECDKFYIKTCDNVGMCTLRIFTYNEVSDTTPTQSTIDTSQFVTKEEFEQIVTELKGEMTNAKQFISTNKQSKPNKQAN